MKTTLLRYSVLIKKEGNNFVAYVPTLGISDFGKTVDEAQHHVRDAIACHIEGLVKTGNDVPTPDSKDIILTASEVPSPKGIRFAL